MRARLSGWIVSAHLLAAGVGAHAQAPAAPADAPPHLAMARELAANLKPEDNQYELGGQIVRFPGDLFSSGYAVRTDCSGLLLALFRRAGYRIQPQMEYVAAGPRRSRPAAEDFVLSIEREKGFRRIRSVDDLRPGDLIAHAMLEKEDQRQTGTTGHVFLLDSAPRAIAPRKPVVEGTRQYEVEVIDANQEYVGSNDTRLADPARKVTGLGRGTIRLYADDQGELVGWARTFANTSRFFSYTPRFPSDTKPRKAAMGRPMADGS